MENVELSQEVDHVLMEPATSFICDEFLRHAKMAEPSTFQCLLVVGSFLGLHNSCSLVLGRQVNEVDDRDLAPVQLNPHHIGLQLLVEV